MSKLGDAALQLINELERSPDTVSQYNETLVKRCTDEIKQLYDKNADDINAMRSQQRGEEVLAVVHARQAVIERNKRCLLVYVHERMQRLKKFRWKLGAVLPVHIKTCLSEGELCWFQEYCRNLADFQMGLGEDEGVDLTVNMQPPKSLFVQVTCVQNYGEFETSDGTVVYLRKHSLHSLPRQDCEPLIRQGILQLT